MKLKAVGRQKREQDHPDLFTQPNPNPHVTEIDGRLFVRLWDLTDALAWYRQHQIKVYSMNVANRGYWLTVCQTCP